MTPTTPAGRHRAVVFDLGGVVLGSPLHAIAAFERDHGIPPNTINLHVVASAPEGAWHRLERGELPLGPDFFAAFDRELAGLGHPVSSADMMERVARISQPRPQMIEAIGELRRRGLLVAALTNNWNESGDSAGARRNDELREHFDLFLESARLGMRKPDPRIYRHTCAELGVALEETVFLDDIGTNLKAARALGMTTIKVDDPDRALDELWSILGAEPGD